MCTRGAIDNRICQEADEQEALDGLGEVEVHSSRFADGEKGFEARSHAVDACEACSWI